MRGLTFDQVFAGDPFSPHFTQLQESQLASGEAMAYYNEGFTSSGFSLGGLVRGLGSVISTAGSVAAAVLPAIYLNKASDQAAAAGPTAHPVISAAGSQMKAAGTGVVATAARDVMKVLDPAALGGPSFAATAGRLGRYAPAGTKGYHAIRKGPHAGLWVRNRHRNPCNIHALRRAISRAHSFEKIARKVIHFTHPRKASGTAHFVKRRRRA